MKAKKLNKKLILNKKTVSNLNNEAMSDVKGGDFVHTILCPISRFCLPPTRICTIEDTCAVFCTVLSCRPEFC
ncbi:MAG: hypothetical protein GY757_11610 [bacterium]|nr:hypothetical protein [bacterium]